MMDSDTRRTMGSESGFNRHPTGVAGRTPSGRRFTALTGLLGLLACATTVLGQQLEITEDYISVTGTDNGEEIEIGIQFIGRGAMGVFEPDPPTPADPNDNIYVPEERITVIYNVLIDGVSYVRVGAGSCGALPGCFEVSGATAEQAREALDLVKEAKQLCVRGRGGDDYIHLEDALVGGGGGGGEISCMYGAEFDAYVDGGDGNDVIVGTSGDDWLRGGAGNDLLIGLAGDDWIGDNRGFVFLEEEEGNDILWGGDGDDFLRGGPGQDILQGGRGSDDLGGGSDYNLLDYQNEGGEAGVTVDLGAGSATDTFGDSDTIAGFEVVRGTALSDTITGYRNRGCTILGGAGDDTLSGGAGVFRDIIYGQAGNDTIFGDDGNDILIGGSGNDTIFGGRPGGGQENGADEIYGDGDPVPPFIRLTPHFIDGNPARPSGFDVLDSSPAGGANPGPALIDISEALTNYNPNSQGTAPPMSGNFLLPCNDDGTVTGQDGEVVSPGNDTLYGDRGADRIAGGGGNDTIYGDYAQGVFKDGNYIMISAGDDDDLIFGDRVHDRATAVAREGDWGPWPATAADVLSSVFGDDRIKGQLGADIIIGGGGADRIMGDEDPRVSNSGGADRIYGDYYFLTQADYDLIAGNVAVPMGDTHGDTIYGGAERDRIFGGPGNDTIIGGPAPLYSTTVAGAVVQHRGDLMQGNQGDDLIIGGEVDPANPLTVSDDGFSVGTSMAIDLNPGDVADYSRVPAASGTSSGIFVDLFAKRTPLGPSGLSGTSSGDGELLPFLVPRNGVDRLIGIENVIGSVNDDVIIGSDPPSTASSINREENQYTRNALGALAFPLGNSPSSYVMDNYPWGFDNILVGNDGNDLIVGRRGDDALWGGAGDDVLWGDNRDQGDGTGTGPGSGYDEPETMGNDQIWGGDGNDEIHGEYGQDILRGGNGEDFISGGAGRDVLDYTESEQSVLINLGERNEDLSGGPAALANLVFTLDQLVDPAATRKFDLTALLPLPGGTYRYPDHENNPLDNQPCAAGNILCAGTGYGENNEMDTISNNAGLLINGRRYRDEIEVVVGNTSAPDVIFGKQFTFNELHGLGGNDMLFGGDAGDRLYGGTGSDLLDGRGGDDHLIGTDWEVVPPGERLESDSDWVSYASVTNPADGIGGSRGAVVDLGSTEPQNTRAAGIDRLTQIENVIGTTFDDVIRGNQKANILYGGNGNDWLVGRSDAEIIQHNVEHVRHDLLHGGPGTDVADYRMSNPAAIRNSLAILKAISNPPACFSDPAVHCFIEDDGETGSDWLVEIEEWREPATVLVPQITIVGTTDPARPHVVQDDGSVVISPNARLRLRASATGGQPPYRAEVTPTTDKTTPTLEDPQVRTVPIVVPATASNLGFNAPFQFEVRPLKTTTFRVTFTDLQDRSDLGQDGGAPAQLSASAFQKVVIAPTLGVTIDRKQYTVRAGESTQLQATITGGQPPITILWTLDNGAPATGLTPTNVLKPTASPMVTTKYLITVRDAVGQVAEAKTTVEVLQDGSGARMVPESGTNSGTAQDGSGSQGTGPSTTSQSLDQPERGQPAIAPVPCGSGVGPGFVLMNLLLLAGMRRRIAG